VQRRGAVLLYVKLIMLTIRSADMDDVASIAEVHVAAWRSTYQGMIPQAYLDGLSVENRSLGWARVLERASAADVTLVSETHDRRVVGFVTAGPARSHRRFFQGEISSLYVLPAFQRGRHGKRLFLAAANRLAEAGYASMIIWVLADNPARAFYEKLGGVKVAETQRPFAGSLLREVAYGWEQSPRYGD
jgi:ribosomal protein S18 acetylase RimI-like enzyme